MKYKYKSILITPSGAIMERYTNVKVRWELVPECDIAYEWNECGNFWIEIYKRK